MNNNFLTRPGEIFENYNFSDEKTMFHFDFANISFSPQSISGKLSDFNPQQNKLNIILEIPPQKSIYANALKQRIKYILRAMKNIYYDGQQLKISTKFSKPDNFEIEFKNLITQELIAFLGKDWNIRIFLTHLTSEPDRTLQKYLNHSDCNNIFYSCNMCSVLKPSHFCIITPEKSGQCGEMTFEDIMLLHEINQHSSFKQNKLLTSLDEVSGIYEELNNHAASLTLGDLQGASLYSSLTHPLSVSPLAQIIAITDPYKKEITLFDRKSSERTPLGLTFEDAYKYASMFISVEGVTGHSRSELLSTTFLRGNGGLKSVAWMPEITAEFLRANY